MTKQTDTTTVDGAPTDGVVTRRAVLRAGAVAGAAGAAGAAAQPVGAADGDTIDFGGWFDDTGNFDGTVDERGLETVRITVGAGGNGGSFAFGPAAVRVDPGTTIVWEWSGDGGSHDAVAENGAFESELSGDAGHTFEWSADREGITKYTCTPHEGVGMRGAVVVGDPRTGPPRARVVGDTITVLGSVGLALGLFGVFLFGTLGWSDPDHPGP